MSYEGIKNGCPTDLQSEGAVASRRQILKVGAVMLPYVVPTVLSFTSTHANACDPSPGGGGGHGGGGCGSPCNPGP